MLLRGGTEPPVNDARAARGRVWIERLIPSELVDLIASDAKLRATLGLAHSLRAGDGSVRHKLAFHLKPFDRTEWHVGCSGVSTAGRSVTPESSRMTWRGRYGSNGPFPPNRRSGTFLQGE